MNPTNKQRAFALAVIEGMTPSEAYRAAGYKVDAMSKANIATEASRLLRNPNVYPIIEQGKAEAAKRAAWSRSLAIERLEAVNAAAFDEIISDGVGNKSGHVFFNSLDRLMQFTEDKSDSEATEFLKAWCDE